MVGEPQLPFGVTNVDHSDPAEAPDHAARKDFLREKVAADAASDRFGRPIHTRFPPEPNGFLHIGHAKSICLNFGVAQEFHGLCNLRFDDTNPTTEDIKYVEAIRNDVRWLGFEWAEERFASDYFERLYEIAEALVKAGKAYVESQSEEAIREGRGTITVRGAEGQGKEHVRPFGMIRGRTLNVSSLTPIEACARPLRCDSTR